MENYEKATIKGLQKQLISAESKFYQNLKKLETNIKQLNSIQKLGKALAREESTSSALDKLIELSIREMGAEKALFLLPGENNNFQLSSYRGYSRRKVKALINIEFSTKDDFIFDVVEKREGILFNKIHGAFSEELELFQMIMIPIISDSGSILGIYIIGFSELKIANFNAFDEKSIDFFTLVGSQVGSTLQNIFIAETFKKFVPRQFLDKLASDGLENIKIGEASSGTVTILFSDIRSFTSISEKMDPQELLNMLNSYFLEMNIPIHENNGFIDKFIGDAIMALFSDNDPRKGAKESVKASLEMFEALNDYNQRRRDKGRIPIQIGVGLHSGDVIVGTVGSKDRMDSTALGDPVNLASRLEGLTKYYNAQIILSDQTYRLICDDKSFICRELDFVKVKGKGKPEMIYEVINSNPRDVFELKYKLIDTYHKGLKEYNNRNWKVALDLFNQCHDIYSNDSPSNLYIERCQHLHENPPPLNWDGILEMTEK